MGDRRRSREFALQALYGVDLSKDSPSEALRRLWLANPEESLEVRQFTEELVKGVFERLSDIDTLITNYSSNWKISRMSVVDRNVLRLAIFELNYCKDIPPKVTLNEAIEMAKIYGTEESGSFVNGILDKAAKGISKE